MQGDTNIILIEKNELILDKMKIAITFKDYFTETVTSLNLFKWKGNTTSLANNLDIIDSIVLKFHSHPSIKTIKNKFRKITKFSFPQVTLLDVIKAMEDIRLDKFIRGDIPADTRRQ